jgi:hypothetical protein
MTWRKFEAGAPAMAAFGREQFSSRIALIGTIRRDGSPRLSCIDPFIMEGDLYLGMMWRSYKALDLLRDPRIVIRNAICSNAGDEVELTLRGRVVEIGDPQVRQRFIAMTGTPWKEPHFHLFSVDIESAACVAYGAGEQSVSLWPENLHFTRPYG